MNNNSERCLVVDGQIFQSAARDRGMGRYSEYLLSAILRESTYKTVYVVFAKKPHAAGISNKGLEHLFDGVTVAYLDLSSTAKQSIASATNHNKKSINEFIQKLPFDPASIDFLIPSLFQEPIVSVFPDKTKNFVIFYDLIPYLYYDRYADKMPFDNYLKRFRQLFEADNILTISQAVRDDLAVYLGIPYTRTSVIDGAAIRSVKKPVSPPGMQLHEKFILMPTSDDPRKNNLRAVLGFEQFNARASEDYKLVITSKIHRTERDRLKSFSKNIVFTGNIQEDELDWLYERAEAVLFVPESEGLGLPILEAVHVDKRVICSSLDVFKEISSDAFYYCDHRDQYSIAAAIEAALSNINKGVSKAKYRQILKHYSWGATAKRALVAMAETSKRNSGDKPKIAVFTPTPSGFSAIGKVVAESHAVLDDYFDVDYYVENGLVDTFTRPDYLKYVAKCHSADTFSLKSYAQYDAVFYHIGNSDYHLQSIANSLYLPGYAILHDTNITDAYRVMVKEGMISQDRKDLEERLTVAGGLKFSKSLTSVVTNQLGIMTHSKYATAAAKEISDKVIAMTVDLATQAPQVIPERTYDHLRLGMAGIIADIKGIEIIERLAKDVKYQNHTIDVFGYNYASADTIERLQSYDNIDISTSLTDYDFVNNMKQLDVFVNYRMAYQGETSLSTLEAMRQGVVVVVRDIGWYAELPDDVVVKVDNQEELIKKLNMLVANPQKMRKIASAAVEYVREHHGHEQYAEGMRSLMKAGESHDSALKRRVELLRGGQLASLKDLLVDLKDGEA